MNRPGVYELPLGTPLREIIEVHAGGVRNGNRLKAIIPGGVSMPVLSAEQVDVRMDHDSLKQAGTLLGTGGIVVMDETACMVRAAIVIARFFRHETCGQCTQCREGTAWLYKLLRRIESGQGTAADLADDRPESAATWKARPSARSPTPPPGRRPGSSVGSAPSSRPMCTGQGCPLPESFEP